MNWNPILQYPGLRRWFAAGVFVALALTTYGETPAVAQTAPRYRLEHDAPLYGGYLPFGGFLRDSGAPFGGYTPWGVQGEGGWLKLNYGLGRGHDDFASSPFFGSDVENGYHRNHNDGSGVRPFERGRGRWNNYGRAGIIPPPEP